ncbi:Nascent polypeptide-associated complex NAC domain [Ostreococcus tauri]|uniref:Nascent polypeptide-associated complex subunit beta n=1 Tax=Ostreococcus tauri TaxID=70448 RepID=Q01EL5_OSTTA|nr:Nascent polypeptide-associated complex NAC domain [Ostreococcus tauri]CAL52238.2 Nascent polypeptide-associated complex NAC domain [Ostreococcus tauri]|eukprot:XP_003074967.1 Nascent polypeptide-associated complex NAC domain [Ostreococcus tauri]
MDVDRLQRLASAVRTGGKGSMRRKKKVAHKTVSASDSKLQNCLKRMQVNAVNGIQEVNIFQGDNVIQFANPKVQASALANTTVVSGPSQTKALQDILPGVFNQLGPENIANLKKMAEQYSQEESG